MLSTTANLNPNNTITRRHKRLPSAMIRRFTYKYVPPVICPHCKEVIKPSPTPSPYISVIWNNKEVMRQTAFLECNRILAEQRGEDTSRYYEYY